MEMSTTGEISFTRPDGRPVPDAPPAPRLQEDCVDQLIAAHEEMGLEIDPWTPTPDWHGERLDLDFAIRALRPLSSPPFIREHEARNEAVCESPSNEG